MIPINQTIVDSQKGDCARAVIASLFELEIEAVPNFMLHQGHIWFDVFYYFIYSLGYQYNGNGHPETISIKDNTINGYCYAVVKSKTFSNSTHAVIINETGLVVHDPNPNKLWEGINIVETGDLMYFYMINKREE